MKFHKVSKIRLVIISLVVSLTGFSQSLYPPKVETPNSASLGKFGEVQVSLFTGMPNISIPIHTLSYGKMSVPIGLRYHASSVKPGQQPGWVGSGWDLESTGSITRQVRGALDEFYISSSTGNQIGPTVGFYYPYPGQTVSPGSEYANASGWNTNSQLVFDFVGHTNIAGLDVQADEFSFNVMGHSGKFYYSGSAKQWEVVSDEKIKVDLIDFYSPTQIRDAIKQFNIPENATALVTSVNQSRMFGGFVLRVPDGTKFYFGGTDGLGIPDAVEFSSNRTTIYASTAPVFTANTWLLKKIVDVNGDEITFEYTRKYPTCNLLVGLYELNASCAQNNVSVAAFLYGAMFGVPLIGSSGTFNSDYVNTNLHSGGNQWPMYLTSIQSLNEIVKFSFSDAICRRYTNALLSYVDLTSTFTNDIDNSVLGLTWPSNLDRLQWEKLDKITITDNMHNSNGINNYNPNIIRQFKFNFNNQSTERLTLNSFQQLDKDNNVIGQYSFSYNNGSGMDLNTTGTGNVIYSDGNYSDHWGFYNGVDINHTASANLFTQRQPNASLVTAGLLNKIVYPTGGYTAFTWESNDYSRVVAVNRQSYVNSNGYGGGSRIFEIKHYMGDGLLASKKTYYYKKNYTAGVDPNTFSSSGVLNGVPQYSFSMANRTGILGTGINNFSAVYFNGIGNFSYTGQGSPIGYDEVVEVNDDGSYTKNLFTNYDTDENLVSHWDEMPAGYVGWDPSVDTYFPRNSLEKERGNPTGVYHYTPTNVLLQKTNFKYRTDGARFSQYAKIIDLNGSYGDVNCGDALVLATARKVYSYAYHMTEKNVTTYDEQGNNPLTEFTSFSYNANNLMSTKTEKSSKDENIVTTYNYPFDFLDVTSSSMTSAHILSPVVQETVVKGSSTVSISRQNYAEPYTGIFAPASIELQVGNNPSEVREKVTKYDAKGHIQEIQKTNDVKEVYIWGCNSQYIMAKIVGADYNTAQALISQLMLDQAGVGYNNYSDADIRTELNKLRTGLPKAMVTTYTYKCGVGVATVTDPNGFTTFYNYDGFGRLITIVDKDNNVLKKFCYNYAGQPENCTVQ